MAMIGFFGRLLRAGARIYPAKVQAFFEQLLKEADIDIPYKTYLGTATLITLFVMIVSFLVSSVFLGVLYALGAMLIAAILVLFLFYLAPLMAADSRARAVEKVLPDAFLMVAANIRAGMTVENAILASAKPEFGPLELEIKRLSTKTFAGTPLRDALKEMSDRVRSKSLKRGIALLIEGNALGGQMASLLYEIAQDLRNKQALQREINNATIMYTIFIVFSTLFASPVLFATSVYYNTISAQITSEIGDVGDAPAGAMMFGSTQGLMSGPPLSPNELKLFAIAAILVTSLFAAFTLAQIRSGKLIAGIKYAPLFVLVAIGLFFGSLYGLEMVFQNLS
ncbi:hypothetical protein DRN67_03160 [Candidatus Micrarchaeota archaeon]|nr:MAG: hypothetical protein DRN67_03160 [Candidatus Micrarchaeota archaeon]